MKKQERSVRFHEEVVIWLHSMTLGDNPTCHIGTPVTLDWREVPSSPSSSSTSLHDPDKATSSFPLRIPLQQLERAQEQRYAAAMVERKRRRQKHESYIPQGPPVRKFNYYQRQAILRRAGFDDAQIVHAERQITRDRRHRAWSQQQTLPIRYVESLQKAWRKIVTGQGTQRYRRRVVKEWYKVYCDLDLTKTDDLEDDEEESEVSSVEGPVQVQL